MHTPHLTPRRTRLKCTHPPARSSFLPSVFVFCLRQHILKYTGGSAFNPGASAQPSLTPGEITGIVAGVLLLVGIPLVLLGVVALFFIVRKLRRGGYARQDASMARDIRSGLTDGGNSSVTASYTDL